MNTTTEDELAARREAKPDDPELEGEGEGEGADDDPEAVIVTGADEQLSLAVGGRKPEESKISFSGGAFPARGQWKKGSRVRFMIEGVIDEVATRDHRDRRTNTVTKTVRAHSMTVEHVETLPAAQD